MQELFNMINAGGVFDNIAGNTVQEVYKNFIDAADFGNSLDKTQVYNALCEREELMSTAIGLGIALAHPRVPIVKDESDERIFIIYPKNPIDMKALDETPVHAIFVILAHSLKTHLYVLNLLSVLFRDITFLRLLKTHLDKKTLLTEIGNAITRISISKNE